MEFTVIETLLYFLLIFITIRFLFKRSGRKLNLPPSPAFSFPVIGHLHLLKPPIHRRFLSLSLSVRRTCSHILPSPWKPPRVRHQLTCPSRRMFHQERHRSFWPSRAPHGQTRRLQLNQYALCSFRRPLEEPPPHSHHRDFVVTKA